MCVMDFSQTLRSVGKVAFSKYSPAKLQIFFWYLLLSKILNVQLVQAYLVDKLWKMNNLSFYRSQHAKLSFLLSEKLGPPPLLSLHKYYSIRGNLSKTFLSL